MRFKLSKTFLLGVFFASYAGFANAQEMSSIETPVESGDYLPGPMIEVLERQAILRFFNETSDALAELKEMQGEISRGLVEVSQPSLLMQQQKSTKPGTKAPATPAKEAVPCLKPLADFVQGQINKLDETINKLKTELKNIQAIRGRENQIDRFCNGMLWFIVDTANRIGRDCGGEVETVCKKVETVKNCWCKEMEENLRYCESDSLIVRLNDLVKRLEGIKAKLSALLDKLKGEKPGGDLACKAVDFLYKGLLATIDAELDQIIKDIADVPQKDPKTGQPLIDPQCKVKVSLDRIKRVCGGSPFELANECKQKATTAGCCKDPSCRPPLPTVPTPVPTRDPNPAPVPTRETIIRK